jgi:hypothetical protein
MSHAPPNASDSFATLPSPGNGDLVHALFRAAAVAARAATRTLRQHRLSVEEHGVLVAIAQGRDADDSSARWAGVRFALIERGLVRARFDGAPGHILTDAGAAKLAATSDGMARVESAMNALLLPFGGPPIHQALTRLSASRLD